MKRLFRKTIVMDINSMPPEYKTPLVLEGIRKYEEDFKVNVIPTDMSRQNMMSGVQRPYKI